jgi:hypothetical protein
LKPASCGDVVELIDTIAGQTNLFADVARALAPAESSHRSARRNQGQK